MARIREAEPVYQAAATWWNDCIMGDGSMLQPGLSIWTEYNLEQLRGVLIDGPVEGEEKFMGKLKAQLASSSVNEIKLVAELLWVMFLFPAWSSITGNTKREIIRDVWGIAPDPGVQPSAERMGLVLDVGMRNPGKAYNLYRWRELAYFVRLALFLKREAREAGSQLFARENAQESGLLFVQRSQGGTEPAHPLLLVLTSRDEDVGWQFAALVDQVDGSRRAFRHILLHLLRPEQFEPVASAGEKLRIITSFSAERDRTPANSVASTDVLLRLSSVLPDVDLLRIRQSLQAEAPGRVLDFYYPPLRDRWREARANGNADAEDSASVPPAPDAAPDRSALPPDEDAVESIASVDFSLTWRVRQGIACAERIGPADGSDIDAETLFLGYLLASQHRRESDAAAALLAETAEQRGGFDPERVLASLFDAHGIHDPPGTGDYSFDPEVIEGSALIQSVLVEAEEVRSRTNPSEPISSRHVLAAFLRPSGAHSVAGFLARNGVRIESLRTAMLRYLEIAVPRDDLGAWSRVFDPPRAVHAGFSTDSAEGQDALGLAREVKALSTIIAARETVPPLSIGLFADWGMGKSFFMKMMEKQIEELGKESSTFYCSNVVQVTFNAWHYMDSNLWASLASQVFVSLADHLKGEESAKNKLFGKLAQSGGVMAAVAGELSTAEKRLEDIQKKIKQTETAQENSAIVRAVVETAFAYVESDPGTKAKLEEAERRLKIPNLAGNVEEVQKQARELGDVIGRFRALWRRPHRILLAASVSALFTVILLAILPHLWTWPEFTRIAVAVGSGIATLAAWIGVMLSPIKTALRWLEDVDQRVQRDKEQQQAQARADLEKLKDEARDVEARVADLKREMDEMRAGRRLHRFIMDRHGSGEYQPHLGIVNLVRADFEQLSRLLAASVKDGSEGVREDGLPSIDRIILYIDDLDRCPEDRVVEVLQAVHLLLAFPLFVVVVGVDSRWLITSLKDHYRALRGPERRPDAVSERTPEDDAESTPQNYLEKIFQIPYTLRPMDSDGFRALVRNLLPVLDVAETGESPAPPPEPEDAATKADSAPSAGVRDTEPRITSRVEHVDGREVRIDTWIDEEEFRRGEDAGDDVEADDPDPPIPDPVPPALDPVIDPAALRVEEWEQAFIERLHPLIRSPRALKRFTNVYRFIRAQRDGDELERFRGTRDAPGEFQVVALLLAALVGYPHEAETLFERVLKERDGTLTWWSLVDHLDYAAPISARAKSDSPRATLRGALMAPGMRSALQFPATVASFAAWVPEVARFSFRSLHVPTHPAPNPLPRSLT